MLCHILLNSTWTRSCAHHKWWPPHCWLQYTLTKKQGKPVPYDVASHDIRFGTERLVFQSWYSESNSISLLWKRFQVQLNLFSMMLNNCHSKIFRVKTILLWGAVFVLNTSNHICICLLHICMYLIMENQCEEKWLFQQMAAVVLDLWISFGEEMSTKQSGILTEISNNATKKWPTYPVNWNRNDQQSLRDIKRRLGVDFICKDMVKPRHSITICLPIHFNLS